VVTEGLQNHFARRRPTVDLPAPINPTSTIGRSSRSLNFCIGRGYTAVPDVGQKPTRMRSSRIAPAPTRRKSRAPGPLVLLILLLVIVAGAIYFLSSQAREVPTRPVEVDVTNAAGR